MLRNLAANVHAVRLNVVLVMVVVMADRIVVVIVVVEQGRPGQWSCGSHR